VAIAVKGNPSLATEITEESRDCYPRGADGSGEILMSQTIAQASTNSHGLTDFLFQQ
jgi:hypothetical protein